MKTILVVDDNSMILTMTTKILSSFGKIYAVDSGADALKFLETRHPDLILLDVKMPVMSGIDLMKILKSDKKLSDIPVIFLTVLTDTENEAYAFNLGAVDYIHKPINDAVLTARVKLHLELESYRKHLQALVDIKTSQVMHLEKIAINLLARVNEFRDEATGYHVKRTVKYVCAIMDNLPKNLPPSYFISQEYYDDIKKSTPIHDIGKISIPDTILLKPDKLTSAEYEIMKTHVSIGAQILQDAINEYNEPSFLNVALEIVLTHHEKWDGTGYPHQLAGEEIPISGRIMAIADIYDALTSKRPYKPAFPHEGAMAIITESSGKHFDPLLVDVFMFIQDDILKIAEQYRNE